LKRQFASVEDAIGKYKANGDAITNGLSKLLK